MASSSSPLFHMGMSPTLAKTFCLYELIVYVGMISEHDFHRQEWPFSFTLGAENLVTEEADIMVLKGSPDIHLEVIHGERNKRITLALVPRHFIELSFN